MTTIVYRDGVMAADTAVFDRGVYVGQAIKIFRSVNGTLGGVAGCFGDSSAFGVWFKNGFDEETPDFKDADSEGLIVHKNGDAEWVGKDKKRFPIQAEYHTIGSGFLVAMGALHIGASALRAVEVAADLDCTTRRPIMTLTHD